MYALHTEDVVAYLECNYTVIAIDCTRYILKLDWNYTVIAIHCTRCVLK